MKDTRILDRPADMYREMVPADRCDSCGARAWVRAVIGPSELLFCAHHGAAHLEALEMTADYVQDDRHLLLEQS